MSGALKDEGGGKGADITNICAVEERERKMQKEHIQPLPMCP